MGVIRCPGCGEENPDRFRLCGFCGARLVPDVAPAEVRKTVTVLFCDLMGSTSLGERMDSESLRELLRTYFAEMKAALERHGGLVEKYIGDAIMAIFGLPRVREDDALRAVRAAVEMQSGLARLNQRLQQEWGLILQNRTGVNTGEVVAGDPATGQQLVTGDTVNVAARLEQACPAMGVLLGETTYLLVRSAVEAAPVEPLALKGKAELVPAYQLLGVHDAEAIPRTVDATLVGRDRELGRLRSAHAARSGRALSDGNRLRPRRNRQVTSNPGVRGPESGPGAGTPWPLPLLWRQHHLLAARRDDPGGGLHLRRGQPGAGPDQAQGTAPGRPGCGGPDGRGAGPGRPDLFTG